jgi:hypothetical protein
MARFILRKLREKEVPVVESGLHMDVTTILILKLFLNLTWTHYHMNHSNVANNTTSILQAIFARYIVRIVNYISIIFFTNSVKFD